MKHFIEPFRIKSIEPIKMTTREEREKFLEEAGHNLFSVKAENVLIDLLTDSGTGAMSVDQWAGIMRGDESYAGARSFYRLEKSVRKFSGMEYILPTHQGRASERILFAIVGREGAVIPSNNHFDTTRANIEHNKTVAVDLVIDEAYDPKVRHPFKGNMDLNKLEFCFKKHGAKNIPLVMMTVTNNSGGGQPVSMENIRGVKKICQKYGVPLYLDACRFAENAFFIKEREKEFHNHTILEIVKEMFALADGATISAKKDGIVNIGGLLLTRDKVLYEKAQGILIMTEGFPTYGGLAGRDLEAMAQGFEEVVQEDYLRYRIKMVEHIGDRLLSSGIQIIEPTGGHAFYIDAQSFYPQIKRAEFPGQVLACELYKEAGVRCCEIGSVMFNEKGDYQGLELVRFAIPRRVYTASHMDYVYHAIVELHKKRHSARGMRITYQQPALRHFTARFEFLK